ncbi:hypothetical protein Clacol_006086 [Clathrus columnatus]|uniref:HNH nuclease domain-containing protein n=1 Tax=Clathrus columnatus TaxID=1419009 RepID=A0AAV5AGN5_9AGAM|nr:hypothetical protein Clacol_006086 [Clathrus columnatus]
MSQRLQSSSSASASKRAQEKSFGDVKTIKNTRSSTPPFRVLKGSTMPSSVNTRVDDETKDLTGSRCLLENTSERNEVQYAHCLRRAMDSHVNRPFIVLNNLEYSWGLGHGRLNLDTSQNVFRLSVKFHRLFDKGWWILVPEESIVDIYQDGLVKSDAGTRGTGLPEIPSGPYNYTIICHPDMGEVPFLRQKDDSIISGTNQNRNMPLMLDDIQILPQPLPGITVMSHVHLRFVICNAGLAMRQSTDALGRQVLNAYLAIPGHSDLLKKILAIYDSWTTLLDDQIGLSTSDALKFLPNIPVKTAELSKKSGGVESIGAGPSKRSSLKGGDGEEDLPSGGIKKKRKRF